MKEIINALATLTGKSADELRQQLVTTADGVESFSDEAAATITSIFREKFDTIKEDGHKRGQSEMTTKFRKWMKSAGYTPKEGDLENQFAEMVESLKPQGGDPVTIDFEKDQRAQEWLNGKVQALKAELDTTKAEFERTVTGYKSERIQKTAQAKALEILEAAKWNAGEDEATRKIRQSALFKLIDYSRLQLDESGNLIVVDESGKPAKDAMHNPVTFEGYVKEANPFGYHQFDPNRRTPPTPPPGKDGQSPTLVVRTKEERDAMIEKTNSIRDAVERNKQKAAILTAYAESQGK